ncbi:acid protease [Trametes punicea]|nr:acid protease [Trametes punicea]
MQDLPLSLTFLLLLWSYELPGAHAARLTLRGRPRQRRVGNGLDRRASIVGNTSVGDAGDIDYSTDITLGGKKFSVLIDTGSSDLWVAGSVPNTQQTGRSAQVQYAVGEIEGPILTASLEFAGYTVDNQAFINASPSSSNPAGTGLIGLGPSSGSQVQSTIGSSAGDPTLDRIFQQDTSTPNFITVLLGRIRDPTDSPTGDLTVGEVLPGYDQITSQPKLPVSAVASSDSGNQHWQILLDADGIIGPAGDNIIDELNIETAVSSTSNKKQLTVVLDTGFSLPQVPSRVAEAFYKNVPGAALVNRADLNGQVWQLPCDKEVNVTFKFSGVKYPIHPLDTNLDLNLTDSSGKRVCVGAFQPTDLQNEPTFDMIFGMAFLRNAYTLINFGDFVDGSTSTTAAPFVQLLSTTNDSAAVHADFIKVRGNSPWTPIDATLGERLSARLPLIIGLSVAAGSLLLIAVGACCFFSARNRGQRRAFFRPAFFRARPSKYQQLHEPAPPEAHDLHLVGNQSAPPAYTNPWDARY